MKSKVEYIENIKDRGYTKWDIVVDGDVVGTLVRDITRHKDIRSKTWQTETTIRAEIGGRKVINWGVQATEVKGGLRGAKKIIEKGLS
jgi:hypothetical protein